MNRDFNIIKDNRLMTNEAILNYLANALNSDGSDITLEEDSTTKRIVIENFKWRYLFRIKKMRQLHHYVPVHANVELSMVKVIPRFGIAIDIEVLKP